MAEPKCPACGSESIVKEGMAFEDAYGLSDHSYRCESCGYAGSLVIDSGESGEEENMKAMKEDPQKLDENGEEMEEYTDKPLEGVTKDEGIIAAISHISILGGPILIPLLIWFLKRKSKYVSFQAKQALLYHLLIFLIPLVEILTGFIRTSVIMLTGVSPLSVVIALLVIWGIFQVISWMYGISAAYNCYKRQDFRYPIIGNFFQYK